MSEAKKATKKVIKSIDAEAKVEKTAKTSRIAAQSNEPVAKSKAIKAAKAKVVKCVKEKADEVDQKSDIEQASKSTTEDDKANVKTEAAKTAKAGRRSAKAIKEAEELAKKETRKAKVKTAEDEQPVVKAIVRTRSKLERRGKKFQEVNRLVDKSREYTLKDSLELATKTNPAKFDATVELHIRLGVDPKQSDQNIRSNLVLPNGTGKTVRVAVFAEADKIEQAQKAGADIAASDEFLQQLDKSLIDFDVLIATPSCMPKLGKYARLLGPKGLMPNPKSGTVTNEVAKATKEAKAGRVEYRIDSNGIIHVAIGKVSFGTDKLLANAQAVIGNIKTARPASVKGTYILSVFIASTMGPGIKVQVNEL